MTVTNLPQGGIITATFLCLPASADPRLGR
jgi:hypothetical protein